MSNLENIDETINRITQLQASFEQVAQPRTDYMLKHFVVGSHDLPGQQFKQVLMELRTRMFSLADLKDDVALLEVEIEEFEQVAEISPKRAEIEIRRKKRRIADLTYQITGLISECETLLAIYEKMPKFTAEEIEQQELEYWSRRLSRQHTALRLGDPGNLAAILQMFTEPGKEAPMIADLSYPLQAFGALGEALYNHFLREAAPAALKEIENGQ